MSKKVYAGLSIFFANKPGSFDWTEKQTRAMFNSVRTKQSGKRAYKNLFINIVADNDDVQVKSTKEWTTIKFRTNLNRPLLSILD